MSNQTETRKTNPTPTAIFAGLIAGLAAGFISYLFGNITGFIIGFVAGALIGYRTVLAVNKAREQQQ